jgi:hypothetical protein
LRCRGGRSFRPPRSGSAFAEQELDELAEYFVETDQWRRLYAGDVDIVYGPKGSGKSALYSLLVTKQQELFDRGILIVPAEPATVTSPAHASTSSRRDRLA